MSDLTIKLTTKLDTTAQVTMVSAINITSDFDVRKPVNQCYTIMDSTSHQHVNSRAVYP